LAVCFLEGECGVDACPEFGFLACFAFGFLEGEGGVDACPERCLFACGVFGFLLRLHP